MSESKQPQAGEHDPNQGEGDRKSARKYDADVRDYVKTGQVEPAAEAARRRVDADPEAAHEAERAAAAGPGPHHATADDLISRGKSVVERVVERVRNAVKK